MTKFRKKKCFLSDAELIIANIRTIKCVRRKRYRQIPSLRYPVEPNSFEFKFGDYSAADKDNKEVYIPGRHWSQFDPAVLWIHLRHSPVVRLQLPTAFGSTFPLQSQALHSCTLPLMPVGSP